MCWHVYQGDPREIFLHVFKRQNTSHNPCIPICRAARRLLQVGQISRRTTIRRGACRGPYATELSRLGRHPRSFANPFFLTCFDTKRDSLITNVALPIYSLPSRVHKLLRIKRKNTIFITWYVDDFNQFLWLQILIQFEFRNIVNNLTCRQTYINGKRFHTLLNFLILILTP